MIRSRWLPFLLLLGGCKAAEPPPVGDPVVTAPSASASVPATRAADPPPDAAAAAIDGGTDLPLITDEECLAKGGKIITEKTYAHLRSRPLRPGEVVRPFKFCKFPSPENGKACASSKECGNGRCMCTGDLSRPNPMNDPALAARDGTPAVGVCSEGPLMHGTWWCMVEGGKANLHGIIID